jgi:hypothetical protein
MAHQKTLTPEETIDGNETLVGTYAVLSDQLLVPLFLLIFILTDPTPFHIFPPRRLCRRRLLFNW